MTKLYFILDFATLVFGVITLVMIFATLLP